MDVRKIRFGIAFLLLSAPGFGQQMNQIKTTTRKDSIRDFKFLIATTWLSFANFEEEKKNLQHYELHVKYVLTPKDRLGVKMATWKLYAPLGIPLWDPHFMKESEYYPGRVREDGLGITYQRMIWKGLFATVEVLPQLKTYFDQNKNAIGNGFKLYTSYHLGYHISLFRNRIFIEPQIHCQFWPIDTHTPQAFKEIDNRWNNYFLLEPNIYVGVKF